METIREGLEKNFNVDIYAKHEFSWKQMKQIKWGLDDKLDVSFYANSKYT